MSNNNSNRAKHTPTARLTSIFAKLDNELAKKRERRGKKWDSEKNVKRKTEQVEGQTSTHL